MKQQIAFENLSPFRRPDWRLERVLQMVDRPGDGSPGRSTKKDDKYVKGLRQFILRYRHYDETARNQLAYENPGLFWAWQIHERRSDGDGQRKADLIEARILARQDDFSIAEELCTIPETMEWYEALFFNVRDRLHGHDWIIDHVLMPAYERSRTHRDNDDVVDDAGEPGYVRRPLSEPFFDATLKFFAYFGGHVLLEYVITGFRRGMVVRSQEEIGGWLDSHYMNRIKHRAAMAGQLFECNRYNVMQLFEINNQIINIERSSDSKDAAKDSQTKAILGMMMEMKWAVGDEGAEMVEGTKLAAYDKGGVELRDHQMLMLSAGQNPGTIEGLDTFVIPPPRRRAGQEDQKNADPQQGS